MATFKDSRKSLKQYLKWRKNRAIPAVNKIKKNLESNSLNGLRVLEIGCGFGPLTSLLLDEGALVTAVEIDNKKLTEAKKLFGKNKNVKFVLVKDEKLNFTPKSFDVIILFDVIEHIKKPQITIKECSRLIKKDGIIYVEFTPYYSPTGHHLYDFAKWPIHALPEEKIKQTVYSKKIKSFMTSDDYWDIFTSLNKLRISDFKKMMKNFKVIEERYIIKYPEVFEINIPFLNHLGHYSDYFTMSFEGIYRK